MAISFVGVTPLSGSTDSTPDTGFVITKPSGVASGDFMVAFVAFHVDSPGSQITVTPPSGWDLADEDFVTNDGYCHQLSVMTRIAGGSEPGSWNGTFGDTVDIEVRVCAAYRGVSGIADSNMVTRGNWTSFSTGSVSNSSSSNWRLVGAGYTSSSVNYDIESNEDTLRRGTGIDGGSFAVELGVWDSGGTISSGSSSRTISRDAQAATAVSWIAILEAGDSTVPGTFEATLPDLSVSASVTQSYDGIPDVELPLLTMSASGLATPPEGSLGVTILPVIAFSGASHAAGELDAIVLPSMNVVGETRQFGIRVITPELESRTTVPRLGAVD